VHIDGAPIGPDAPPYVIAEAGVNHNGDLDTAEALVDAAAEAGADAVKFQTFSADRLVTRDAAKADYQTETTGEGTQYEMLKRYELDRAAHERLLDRCAERGITFLSTPFDPGSADMLAELGLPAIKLGSGELDNHPLLEHVAGLGLPMVVSTGMGTMAEVRAAREAIRGVDPDADVVFLHCTSAYPCPLEDANLRAMGTMAEELEEPVGYSDHTTLPETPSFAVAAGACVVEKHFTLDSTMAGPDHEASLEPDELARAVDLVRAAARARGSPEKRPTEVELENRTAARKSLHAAADIPAGTTIERSHVDVVRPGDGVSPRHLDRVVGAVALETVPAGEPIPAGAIDVDLAQDADSTDSDEPDEPDEPDESDEAA
jgi:N-acetylneuraminate synthase/N,N'-diacetyllegionaminate synthase